MRRLLAPLVLLVLLAPVVAGCESPTGDTTLEERATPLSAEARSAFRVLPANAQFLSVADVRALRGAGLFDGKDVPNATGETGARLEDFFDATGFTPAEDVQTVYVAKPKGDDAAPQLALAADFDRARFEEQLAGELGARFEKETYRGQPLYHRTSAEGTFSFAFTAGGLILLAPDADAVRAMIDRLETGDGSISEDSELLAMSERVRGRGDHWFVARGLQYADFGARGDSTGFDAPPQLGRLAQVVRSTAGAVSLSAQTADGEVFFYTQPGAAPSDLRNVFEGLVSALASREDLPQEKRRALESIEIEEAGDDAVRVAFSFERSAFEN